MKRKIAITILMLLAMLFVAGCVTFTGTNEPGIGNFPMEIDGDGEALLFLTAAYCCLFLF